MDLHDRRPSQCLAPEDIALFVDAMMYNLVDLLPEEMKVHVSECEECARNALELYIILKDQRAAGSGHPYFGRLYGDAARGPDGSPLSRFRTRWMEYTYSLN